MNKKLFLAVSAFAISGMLASCGSDETSEVTTPDTATETEQQESDAQVTEGNDQTDSTEEETSSAGNSQSSEQTSEENPTELEGTLTVSDSQSYELYLMPDYTLVAEEPNKDVVTSTENDELFMRVETFKQEELDWNTANESIQQTLKASNENAELIEFPAFEEPEFTNSAVYEIPTENGKITGAAFEKEGLIVKLTIFDLTGAGVTQDFINMGKTISAK